MCKINALLILIISFFFSPINKKTGYNCINNVGYMNILFKSIISLQLQYINVTKYVEVR